MDKEIPKRPGLAEQLKAQRISERSKENRHQRTVKLYIAQRRAEELKEEGRLGSKALEQAKGARVSIREAGPLRTQPLPAKIALPKTPPRLLRPR